MAIFSEAEIDEIKKLPGETIGSGIKEDLLFVLNKEGKEGLKKIEESLQAVGCPVKLKEVKSFRRYPLYCNYFLAESTKKIFNWTDDDFRENGKYAAKVSAIVRVMLKYFISPRQVLGAATGFWKRYYTVGELQVEEINEKEQRAIIVLKNFRGYNSFCRIAEGYLYQTLSYVVEKNNLKVIENECPLREGRYHRFVATW